MLFYFENSFQTCWVYDQEYVDNSDIKENARLGDKFLSGFLRTKVKGAEKGKRKD